MSAEEKNAISHRGRAVRLLAEYLRGGEAIGPHRDKESARANFFYDEER